MAITLYLHTMARPVTVTLEHDKTVEDARRRIDEGIAELTGSITGKVAVKIEKEWVGDTLHFTAKALLQKLTGTIDVFPQHVRITVTLPDLLAGMAEKIAGQIQKQGTILLEDKRA